MFPFSQVSSLNLIETLYLKFFQNNRNYNFQILNKSKNSPLNKKMKFYFQFFSSSSCRLVDCAFHYGGFPATTDRSECRIL